MALQNHGRYTDLDERVLRLLLEKGPMTLKEIQQVLSRPKSTCESAIRRLEKAGYIEKRVIDGKFKYALKFKWVTELVLDKIDNIRKELESDQLKIIERKEYEFYVKRLSKMKLVTPIDYRNLDFWDWLEFVVPLKEVNTFHPFFSSMEDYVNHIRESRLFDELVMIKIVSLLRDSTIIYYYCWEKIVESSSLDELENALLHEIPERYKELFVYKELECEGKVVSRPSIPEEFMNELLTLILQSLKDQVAQEKVVTKLEKSKVIEKIDKEIKRRSQKQEY